MKLQKAKSLIQNLNRATVTFTKVNGSKRVMKCTLSENLVPKNQRAKLASIQTDGDTLTVWDLEKNGWRSFHVDSATIEADKSA